jgi:hypothetical protein
MDAMRVVMDQLFVQSNHDGCDCQNCDCSQSEFCDCLQLEFCDGARDG